ncbi:hypothetical protein DRQ07_05990 [candidate division KSB1 bacterium]|nr:MAG: hypothetical protein DRQ07_05990 [candidate division KSB1 bacterium]
MNLLLYPVILPVLAGFICFVFPKKLKLVRDVFALLFSAALFVLTLRFFINRPDSYVFNDSTLLKIDNLSGFMLLGIGFFGFIITLYSLGFMNRKENLNLYYGSVLMTLGTACGAVLANNLILLLVFWGFLGVTLYLLIITGKGDTGPAALKTMVIIGGSDALFLFSIVIIHAITGTYDIDKILLNFNNFWVYFAFILLILTVSAKAGSMPLHTWIPKISEKAPIPVLAFIPAALDKLIGIYLLGRICLSMFSLTGAMNLLLMITGVVTIIAAVMMALIQHDFRKLLAYHAVSQVGYMILGIGTGSPIGILGGLFHMLNNSIYKTCLFLTGGAVKKQSGTADLNKMGGLGKLMPVTFIAFFIAALSISGVPPFNGFASKWLIYQGLIDLGQQGDKLWIIWLIAAMFGSGLTLASFMKLTHAMFLGAPSENVLGKKIKEENLFILIPSVILAGLCVVFGVFAFSVPIKHLLMPVVGKVSYLGLWKPGLATFLIFMGFIVGLIIYLAGSVKVREAEPFIGGEKLPVENRVSGTGFYNTIKNMAGIKWFYEKAKLCWFDIYEQCNNLLDRAAQILRPVHTGVLSMYMVWLCFGLAVLIFVLMGR